MFRNNIKRTALYNKTYQPVKSETKGGAYKLEEPLYSRLTFCLIYTTQFMCGSLTSVVLQKNSEISYLQCLSTEH